MPRTRIPREYASRRVSSSGVPVGADSGYMVRSNSPPSIAACQAPPSSVLVAQFQPVSPRLLGDGIGKLP